MKTCEFCEKTMKTQNFSKHNQVCIIRREFNTPKSVILEAIGGKPVENSLEDLLNLNDRLTSENSKCVNFVRRFVEEANFILVANSSDQDYLAKIAEMSLSTSTAKEYVSEWRIYNAWSHKNKMSSLSPSTASSYIAHLKVEVSTAKTKRNRLQSILRHLTGQSVVLPRIRRRIRRIPKHKMSAEEVLEYLKEQQAVSYEDYIVQLIMLTFGCRIHSCSSLRVSHLEFLRGGAMMILPDSKTGDREVEVADPLKKHLRKWLNKNKLTFDDFLFSAGSSADLKKRANVLCMRINKRIKKSNVLRKSPNYKLSSHMFRHTKAFEVFREHLERGKQAARSAIGHSHGTSSIEYYLK
jgi:integrase